MSQAKVDKYKVEKANRKDTIAKQKRNRIIAKICGTIVSLAIVAWIGVSVVTYVIESRPVDTIYANVDGIENYLTTLYEEETEDESEASTDKEESTEESTEASTEESTDTETAE